MAFYQRVFFSGMTTLTAQQTWCYWWRYKVLNQQREWAQAFKRDVMGECLLVTCIMPASNPFDSLAAYLYGQVDHFHYEDHNIRLWRLVTMVVWIHICLSYLIMELYLQNYCRIYYILILVWSQIQNHIKHVWLHKKYPVPGNRIVGSSKTWISPLYVASTICRIPETHYIHKTKT